MSGEVRPPLEAWEGVAVTALEARWGVPLLEAHEALASTNDRARTLASRGAAPFTVVVAETQTAGRGRRGRTWHSPPGAGVWMSLVLRPAPVESGLRLLPLLVGLAAARGMERVAPAVVAGLKWPNDVEVGGRKVAGVLCETAPGGAVVAGVGMNVGEVPDLPDDVRARATWLEAEAGGRVDRVALAGAVVAEARRLLDAPVVRLDGALAREVERRDVLRGRRVRLDDGREGVAAGLAADGALLVEREGGVAAVVAGGVRAV